MVRTDALLVAALGASLVPALTAALTAFLLSLAVPPLALFISLAVFLGAILVAVPHALVLGILLYLVLPKAWRGSMWAATLGGFVVGALPVGIGIYDPPILYPTAEAFGSEAIARIVRAVEFGCLGAIGGFTFQTLVRRREAEPSGRNP